MARWVEQRWEPSLSAPTKAGRTGGSYRSYLPDALVGRPLAVPGDIAERAGEVEAAIRGLKLKGRATSLEALARFLLRSEAIASSRIEGLQVSAQNVALADLVAREHVDAPGLGRTARLVANNIAILRTASGELAAADAVTAAGIDDLQRALLPDEEHHGQRTVQNWIGGSAWNPIGADFVPPAPDVVPSLIDDLVRYMNSAVHAPLIQAALVHAQFETIHPYTDGNGRVGRSLIHTVLTRRGLTPYAVLPISLVLLTRSHEYVDGLTLYRYEDDPASDPGVDGVAQWLEVFLEAASQATEQVGRFAEELDALSQQWREQVAAHRLGQGKKETPRADSAVTRVLAILPEAPLLTGISAQQLVGGSPSAAFAALEELADAKVLTRKRLDGRARGYVAGDVFELLTFAERRLASTRWDTREARPSRPTPAAPEPQQHSARGTGDSDIG